MNKKEHSKEKSNLHPRNRHRERYNFDQLMATCPALKDFVSINKYGDQSIDFFDPKAVKILNKALLKHFYEIDSWDIPEGYLCPPIPGRADYIHYIADLLSKSNDGKTPYGKSIRCLDIGVGANCVYPIIGSKEYAWSFSGSDIDVKALESAKKIIESNSILKENVDLYLQEVPRDVFYGVIDREEPIDVTICNPPFHSSFKEAQEVSKRKVSNLKKGKVTKLELNFGGTNSELWCEGGEKRFVRNMIRQSQKFSKYCFWFTTLVSKQAHLNTFYTALKKEGATEVKTIEMGQGNKISRILAWTFLNLEQQKEWVDKRWK